MKAILNEVGITSILVTHDQEEAFDIADNVAVFNRCCNRNAHAGLACCTRELLWTLVWITSTLMLPACTLAHGALLHQHRY